MEIENNQDSELLDQTSMQDIAKAIRAIRKQKGLTLRDVEEKSNGVWKSVVIGSYERCDRTLSLKKAIALAKFYEVPLDQLLGLSRIKSGAAQSLILDLRAIYNSQFKDYSHQALVKFTKTICERRRDWNGELLSIRSSDLLHLSIITGIEEALLTNWLKERNFIFN